MWILRLIVISGIFSRKEEDLDILPPPPPFPEIGEEIKKTEKTEKQKAREEKKKQLEEEKRKAQEEKAEQEERARKEKERQEQQKIKEEKSKQRKESAFKFFNKLGLVKTEEQKKEAERKRKEEARKKEEDKKRKEAEKARLEREKKKEEEKRQREAEKKRLAEEKKREAEEKRKLEEKRKQEEIQRKKLQKADEERKKALKQKTFDFWNKVGLAMTEEEFEKHRKHREGHKKAKLESGKRLEEHERRLEEERKKKEQRDEMLRQKEENRRITEEKKAQKEIERQLKAGGKTKEAEQMQMPAKFEQPVPEKKPLFGNIFKKTKLDRELEELEKGIAEGRERPIVAHQRIEGAREADYGKEIQKAIEGVKKEKKPSPMFSGFFAKRKKPEVGLPGVMPRTAERHDPLHSIEAKLHKARLALMDLRLEDGKRLYIEIMEIYNGLDAKDKAKVYNDVKDLYYERKGAERYAK